MPLDGALPLSLTCDHAGPIAGTVADARLVTKVLAARTLPLVHSGKPQLAVPAAYLHGRLHSLMRVAFQTLLEHLIAAGAVIVPVRLPDLELTLAAYTPIVRAEAAAVHASALHDAPEGFSKPIREALERGSAMPRSHYVQALDIRRRVIESLREAFRATTAEAIILPTTPAPALRRGANEVLLESGPLPYRDAQLALTAPFSMAGTPVAAIPIGDVDGLPVGVQIVTRWGEDALALNTASWMEQHLP